MYKQIMEVNANMPLWLAKIIKPFCSYLAMAPKEELKQIANAIDEERYKVAEGLLWVTEFEWGKSGITQYYSTMIDFLGAPIEEDEEFYV